MRKNIFKTMFIAAAALAFASCSKDATTDLTPSRELSGLKKTISLNAGFAGETRTELSADHKLTWTEKDVFGILAADAQGVLENVAVAIAEGTKADEGGYYFESIEVPEETTTLYCYYPYSESYDELTDINEFTVCIPNFYGNDAEFSSYGYYDEEYAGDFLPQFHYMAATAEVTGEDATVTFKPLVSIVEFNLYDSTKSGEKFNNFYFAIDKADIAGTFSVDFSDNSLKATEGESALTWIFTAETALSLKDNKADGTKLYAIVPKGEYDNATLTLGSTDHAFQGGYFNDLEWENGTSFIADGHTVNIDLKHAMPAPLAQPLTFTQVDGNPFFATVPVIVQEACDFFAIRVYDTSAYNNQKNNRNEDGKNQYDQMIEQLYDAYVTEYIGNGNKSKISNYQYSISDFYPFLGYNDESITDLTPGPRTLMITEDWQLLYDGRWNTQTEKWDLPGHRSILRPKTNYTFVAYAKARPSAASKYGSDFVVYETEFTTPDLQFNGIGKIEIDYTQAGSTATAQIKGTNIKKIITWVVGPKENTPKTPLTGNDVIDAFNNRSDVYFKDFEGDLTITQTGMNPGDIYYICAAGVDEDGKLVAADPVPAQAADIEFNGYEISDVELASQPTKLGEVELTFTVKDSPKYLRIYTGAPRLIDGVAADNEKGQEEQKAQTWAEIQGYFKNNSYSANYAEVEVTGNTVTTKISLPENEQILPDGEYDYVDNPGHNPFYILIVGADAKGDAITKLGNIYQITGEYKTPKVEMCVEDIHRGVKVGDTTHTRTDETAYFYTCPVSDFDKVEPEPEPEVTNIWSSRLSFSFGAWNYTATNEVAFYASPAYASDYGRVWIISLGNDSEIAELFSSAYYNTPEIREKMWPMVTPLFTEYAETGEPNSSANILHTYASGTIPTSYNTDVRVSLTPQIGDLYAIVAEDIETTTATGKHQLLVGYFGTYTQMGAAKFPTAAVVQQN